MTGTGKRPEEAVAVPTGLTALGAPELIASVGRAVASAGSVENLRRRAARTAKGAVGQELQSALLTLGVLGIDDVQSRTLLTELASVVTTSKDAASRKAMAQALTLCGDGQAGVWWLARLARDDDPVVRLQAATGLSTHLDLDLPNAGDAIECLMGLFHDAVPEVRDMAVFALAVQTPYDSDEMRDSLVPLLQEQAADTAGEAALALAMRRDPRVLPEIRRRLVQPDVGNLWVEAAGATGDTQFLPLLIALRESDWASSDPRPWVLAEAIELILG